MQVIINVEDVGLHPAVGRAVSILREKGVVTAFSVKANESLEELDPELMDMDVGVHLDILRGRPVSHWQHVATLCDEFGSFLSSPVALFSKYAIGKVEHAHVEAEWRAQIERILGMGIQPTHLTSYKHLHGWPSFAQIATGLAREYGIKWLRKPIECAEIAKLDKTPFPAKFQSVCGFFDRESSQVNWTDWVWEAQEADDFSPSSFLDALSGLDADIRVGEICCCPGALTAGDEPIPYYSNPPATAHRWNTEFKSLVEDPWAEALHKVELVSYSDLNAKDTG